ncbi:hypothetical protein ACWC5C_12245 [Streptomyces sp. NPDC001700]
MPARTAAAPPPKQHIVGKRRTAHTTRGRNRTAEFDARALTDGQFDELVHRLIGPLTRLLRTEFRLDRERIGKLRDPRR